jgi:hypothetical protein
MRNGKAYGPDGRYVETIVNDHLIYRSTNSASVGSLFALRASSGHAYANHATTADWGEEPNTRLMAGEVKSQTLRDEHRGLGYYE